VLDVAAGELRVSEKSLRLQPQPLQVLLALLQQPGKVVTRDELRASLWPDDTYGAFDDGLNHAIRRLREALGDTAQVPRYIETVPRRGYRLIAKVEVEAPTPTTPPLETERSRRRLWLAFAAAFAVALVLIAVASIYRRPSARIESVAVLPLANYSGDAAQDYFSDGITDELTTELARIKSLRVISRTSAMQMKGTKLSLQEIGRQLGVDAVIEGSVQRAGNHVRITAQLVTVGGERHLWAETYEREFGDVLHVRSEVAREIAAAVRHEIAPAQAAGFAASTVSPEAYDAYLMGKRLADRGEAEGFEKSIPYFEQAIRLDPSFAIAYTELAESHAMLAYAKEARDDHFTKANAFAKKADELEPNLPEAQIGYADLLFYWEWDWSQCDGGFGDVAKKYPYSSQVQYHYGLCLFVLGRQDEALLHLESARLADPLSPIILRWIGLVLGEMGRNQEAVAILLKARDLEPDSPAAYSVLSWAFDRANREQDSIDAYIKTVRLAGGSQSEIDALDRAYRSGGKLAFEQQRMRIAKAKLESTLRAIKKNKPPAPMTMAYLCVAAGETDLAFRYLNKAYDEHSPRLVWIKSSNMWQPLRRDPRFHALVQRMGLPD
jgi:TolB-like protein/DNA-binding winged helix-turn-helix (wHTH) protein/Tfp pilus assembly protein PilF